MSYFIVLCFIGGNKGIGKAICQLLLEQYPDVHVILGSRDPTRGQQAVSDITATLGSDKVQGRLETLTLDTGSDDSVKQAATKLKDTRLYGIINNAGVHSGSDYDLTVNTNYLGPRRVCEALLKNMERPGGRIVNIGSASGPMYVAACRTKDVATKLSQPWTMTESLKDLDNIANNHQSGDAYGFSKALLAAYTWILAKEEPDLLVNTVTPGFIDTDMTAGWGASKTPADGAVPPVWLLMSDDILNLPTGRYYGSDCKRSPLDVYRGPGDPRPRPKVLRKPHHGHHKEGNPFSKVAITLATIAAVSFCAYMGYQGETLDILL